RLLRQITTDRSWTGTRVVTAPGPPGNRLSTPPPLATAPAATGEDSNGTQPGTGRRTPGGGAAPDGREGRARGGPRGRTPRAPPRPGLLRRRADLLRGHRRGAPAPGGLVRDLAGAWR